MAVWECAECTATYAVGAPRCPQCGSVVRVNESTRPDKEENDMAKTTVHGGPSNAAAEVEGGEESSPGSSSETSSEKEPTSPGKSEKPSPSRARKTASRSARGQTDTSTAPSTDGDPAAGTSASDEG